MYTAFAAVYDRLMHDVPYDEWAAFYRDILAGMEVADGSAVVECACGTGNLTIPLARYYRMTGVDNAQDMLSRAALKARTAGQEIRLIRQDMRALQLHRAADAVLCTCDGLNYLTNPQDVSAFFAAAFAALRPGGVLAFDVSSLYKLQHTLGTDVRTQVDADISYIWRSRWSAEDRLSRMEVTVFALRGDGAYDRIEECQVQRAYTPEELTALLAQAGFEAISVRGDRHHNPPYAHEQRLHIAARRPGI